MGILRTDRVTGLGGANAIKGSVYFPYVTSGGYFHQFQQIQSDDYAFGTGNFTLECWYYMDGDGGHTDSVGNIILLTGTNSLASTAKNGVWLASRNDNKFEARVYYASGSWNMTMTSTNAFTRQTWYHLAMVRSGSSVKLYVNGVQEASGSSSSDLDTTVSTSLYIGAQGNATGTSTLGSRGITGYVSNVRVSNEALYTAAFTPPVGELQKLSSTITLCNQSPSDVLKEETGKTITLYRKTLNHQLPLATRFTPNSPVGFSTTTDVGTQFGSTFDGVTTFDSQAYMVPPGGNIRERNRGRAVFTGGYNAPQTGTTEMEFFNIQSGGLTEEFGNQSVNRRFAAGLASATRGVTGGSNGTPSWVTGTMEFVTIANSSNTTTFGNMTAAAGMVSACSSSTRGIFFSVWDTSGSGPAHKGHIDFITIATTGNSADFGQLSVSRPEAAGFSSPTRGICAGGYPAPDGTTMSDVIDFITIATTGNATNFGDLTQARQAVSGASSQTRGVVAGGYVYGSPAGTFNINTIDFITIASTGDALDFGDLIVGAMAKSVGNCSDLTRGVFAGGKTSAPTYINTIEFVTIASTGNASDFGDLKRTRAYGSVLSDSHGGLS